MSYETMYKALRLRCSRIAETLHHYAALGEDYLESLAESLDTPIAEQDAADVLAWNAEDVK